MLSSLLGAMTLTSGLLLMLEPGPRAPLSDLQLSARVEERKSNEDLLFETDLAVQPGRWKAIVVHHSGTGQGSLGKLNQLHEEQRRGGLGYHFVLNNGRGAEDGLIEVGFRWQRQLVGFHSFGTDGDWRNRQAIGICLIGDGDRQTYTRAQFDHLLWLVHQLQRHLGIPAEKVIVEVDPDGDVGIGRLFPLTQFRQQLLVSP